MKKRKLIFVLLCVLSCFLFVGCDSPKGIAPIGGKVEIDIVQHVRASDYELGIKNNDGNLKWVEIGSPYVDDLVKVHFVTDLQRAYVVREQDYNDNIGDIYDMYSLYLPDNASVDAGVVKVGKNDNVQSQIIK